MMKKLLTLTALLACLEFAACQEDSDSANSDSEVPAYLDCAEAARITVGPPADAAAELFTCPPAIAEIDDIANISVPEAAISDLFDNLWGVASAYIDPARITNCSDPSLNNTCEAAEYTDENNVTVSYAKTVDSIGQESKKITVNLPAGLTTWTALEVKMLASSYEIGAFYYGWTNRYSASWTGVPMVGLPADDSIIFRDKFSLNKSNAITKLDWHHGTCTIQNPQIETYNLGFPNESSIVSGYKVNNAKFRTVTQQNCPNHPFDIVRVVMDGKCAGLVRSDTLEYLGPCVRITQADTEE